MVGEMQTAQGVLGSLGLDPSKRSGQFRIGEFVGMHFMPGGAVAQSAASAICALFTEGAVTNEKLQEMLEKNPLLRREVFRQQHPGATITEDEINAVNVDDLREMLGENTPAYEEGIGEEEKERQNRSMAGAVGGTIGGGVGGMLGMVAGGIPGMVLGLGGMAAGSIGGSMAAESFVPYHEAKGIALLNAQLEFSKMTNGSHDAVLNTLALAARNKETAAELDHLLGDDLNEMVHEYMEERLDMLSHGKTGIPKTRLTEILREKDFNSLLADTFGLDNRKSVLDTIAHTPLSPLSMAMAKEEDIQKALLRTQNTPPVNPAMAKAMAKALAKNENVPTAEGQVIRPETPPATPYVPVNETSKSQAL